MQYLSKHKNPTKLCASYLLFVDDMLVFFKETKASSKETSDLLKKVALLSIGQKQTILLERLPAPRVAKENIEILDKSNSGMGRCCQPAGLESLTTHALKERVNVVGLDPKLKSIQSSQKCGKLERFRERIESHTRTHALPLFICE